MKDANPKNPFVIIVEFATRHFIWIAFIIYASGFLILNYYLSHFGFFEYNLIQTRFLSTGLFLWLPCALILIISIFLLEKIPIKYVTLRGIINFGGGAFIGIWFSLFPLLFPLVQQVFGGGKPVPASIIGTPEQIAFLANFDIPAADNATGKKSVQTLPVCVIYQNDQHILFFNTTIPATIDPKAGSQLNFNQRVISLRQDQFLGLQQSQGSYPNLVCGLSGSLYRSVIKIPLM